MCSKKTVYCVTQGTIVSIFVITTMENNFKNSYICICITESPFAVHLNHCKSTILNKICILKDFLMAPRFMYRITQVQEGNIQSWFQYLGKRGAGRNHAPTSIIPAHQLGPRPLDSDLMSVNSPQDWRQAYQRRCVMKDSIFFMSVQY